MFDLKRPKSNGTEQYVGSNGRPIAAMPVVYVRVLPEGFQVALMLQVFGNSYRWFSKPISSEEDLIGFLRDYKEDPEAIMQDLGANFSHKDKPKSAKATALTLEDLGL